MVHYLLQISNSMVDLQSDPQHLQNQLATSNIYNKSQNFNTNMKRQENYITDNNIITQGLNFLVPQLWWKNFLTENSYIHDIRQMKIGLTDPISQLYELGIIDQQPDQVRKAFNNLMNFAQSAFRLIKKKLSAAERVQAEEAGGKRNRVGCDWLEQSCQFQRNALDLLLQSPKIKQEVVDLFEMGEESWVLIAPQLYRVIWLKQLQSRKDNVKNELKAIPIIMSKLQLQNFKRITFSNKKYLEVFFKNYSGYSFAFVGYIDDDLQLHELVNYLDDGLFRLIGGSKQSKSLQKHNMLLRFDNLAQIIYDLQNEQISQNLGWIPFSKIRSRMLKAEHVNQISIFAASYPTDTQMPQENQQNLEPFFDKTVKKRKGDFSLYHDDSRGMKKMQRAGFRTIPESQGSRRQNKRDAVEPIDVHSSTQEQTPFQERLQRNVIIIQDSAATAANRITTPLWRQNLQAQKLIKYGQIRITIPKIYRPYSEHSTMVLRDEGKKIVLPKRSNDLMIDEEEQLMQKQISQPMIELGDQPPSDSVKKQLEMLALQILGLRIEEMVESAQKVQQTEIAKPLSQKQTKTCKNQFMDILDCEESREN